MVLKQLELEDDKNHRVGDVFICSLNGPYHNRCSFALRYLKKCAHNHSAAFHGSVLSLVVGGGFFSFFSDFSIQF